MSDSTPPILVFGATGQQGGSVAAALLDRGRPVRAFVRDPGSAAAQALRAAGAALAPGSFADPGSIRAAMAGVAGVFSVQPSSPGGTVTDDEEVRFGLAIAGGAVAAGVRHLVYSSGGAVGDAPTGLAHFDTKMRIEAHVRALPITWTVVRPACFMEMLLLPAFGLPEGRLAFLQRFDQPMQFIAVADIGRIVAAVFDDPARFGRTTFEIAGDAATGRDLEAAFGAAAGRPIPYGRFPDELLAGNPFLARLTALLDAGPLAGHADLDALRRLDLGLLSVRAWLAGDGRRAFLQALGGAGPQV